MSVMDPRTMTRKCTRSLSRGLALALILAISVLSPSGAAAQSSPTGESESAVPILAPREAAPEMAGHRFTTTAAVRSPFVRTYYRNTLGVAATSGLSVPPIEIGGEQVQFETGSAVFSMLQIEYQQAVTEWLGAWVDVQVSGRLGTETQSLLSQGVTVVSGFDFGWLVRAVETDDVLLSGTVQLTNAGYTAVDLLGFVDGVVEDGLTPDDRLVYDTPLMVGSAGASCAWVVNPTVGVTAAASLGYGESAERNSSSKWYFDLGAAVDFDLRRSLPIPLGAAAGFRSTSLPASEQLLEGDAKTAAVRLDYIGKHDLNMGLEVASQWLDVRDFDDSLRYTSMTLDFRYYF